MTDSTSSQGARQQRGSRQVAPPSPGSAASDGSGAGSGSPTRTHLGNLHLVDPLQVFAGLAAACVPVFCDGLQFELAGAGANSIKVSYPAPPDGDGGPSSGQHDRHPAGDDTAAECAERGGRISITVHSEPTEGEAAIEGSITCTWRDPQRPTEADAVMARLLADQALAKIRMESLAAALHEQRKRAANLELALATNREIGQAIGILMAIEHVTAAQAFERLRTASQHSHRKLRDIAADVTQTGVLSVMEEPASAPSGLAPHSDTDPAADPSSMHSGRPTRGAQPLVAAPTDA